jgi:hypothetical protein
MKLKPPVGTLLMIPVDVSTCLIVDERYGETNGKDVDKK